MTKIRVWNEIRNKLQDLEACNYCNLVFEDSEFTPFENIIVTEWYVPASSDWETPVSANKMRIMFLKVAKLLNLLDDYVTFTENNKDGKIYNFKCGNEVAFYVQLAPIWL